MKPQQTLSLLFLFCMVLQHCSPAGNKYMKIAKIDYEAGKKIIPKNKEKFSLGKMFRSIGRGFQSVFRKMNCGGKTKKNNSAINLNSTNNKLFMEDLVEVKRRGNRSQEASGAHHFRSNNLLGGNGIQKNPKIQIDSSRDKSNLRNQALSNVKGKQLSLAQKPKDRAKMQLVDPRRENAIKSNLKHSQMMSTQPKQTQQLIQKSNPGKPMSDSKWEKEVNQKGLQYLNDFRKSKGLKALEWEDKVYKAIRPHTQKMMKIDQISHDNFDSRADKIEKCFKVRQSAENVAFFSAYEDKSPEDTARKLTDQWISSPGHRKNMLLPHLTHAGISILRQGKDKRVYFGTQFFVRK